jgi:hypothetical protein
LQDLVRVLVLCGLNDLPVHDHRSSRIGAAEIEWLFGGERPHQLAVNRCDSVRQQKLLRLVHAVIARRVGKSYLGMTCARKEHEKNRVFMYKENGVHQSFGFQLAHPKFLSIPSYVNVLFAYETYETVFRPKITFLIPMPTHILCAEDLARNWGRYFSIAQRVPGL